MVTFNDVLKIELSKADVLSCIEKTKKNLFIDNLRARHPNVKFDCKLRGFIGELGIAKWFNDNGIDFTINNYLEDDDNIDIDFLIRGKNIELKTSLIPDSDRELLNVISRRDIKLIKRGNDTIEQLRGDIHMQIYFLYKRKEHDNWLRERVIDLNSNDYEYLYEQFQADNYLNSTYFVAWIDKPTLVRHIQSLPPNQRTWSFPNSQRLFWNCKLRISRKPMELIAYLNNQ